jgi:DNA-binding response OmpR family regulator
MIKILFLCSDPWLSQLFGAYLGLAGYQYQTVTTPQETIDLLKEQIIDLLVLDDCSQETGKGAWEWTDVYDIMKADPQMRQVGVVLWIPKIYWTSEVEAKKFYARLDAHGDKILVKPFPFKDLLTAVETTLQHYGKVLPTLEERQTSFEASRLQLQQVFNCTDEELERKHLQCLSHIIDPDIA